jgi:hypothetical protein
MKFLDPSKCMNQENCTKNKNLYLIKDHKKTSRNYINKTMKKRQKLVINTNREFFKYKVLINVCTSKSNRTCTKPGRMKNHRKLSQNNRKRRLMNKKGIQELKNPNINIEDSHIPLNLKVALQK